MRMGAIIILAALLVVVGHSFAADQMPDSLFARGCDLYEQGEFESAADAFEAALRGGLENADLYYDLGNTYYRLGLNGKAVANYRRALMLDPRNEDVRANLDFVRTMVGTRDTLAAMSAGGPVDMTLKWFSPREVRAVFYITYYLAALAFLGVLFLRGGPRRFGLYALVVFAVVAATSFALSERALSRFRDSSSAVVVDEQVDLRSGPGNAFERIATLRDGVELKLKSRSAMWVEVQLPTGEVGWLRDTDIEKI